MSNHLHLSNFGFAISAASAGTLFSVVAFALSICFYSEPHFSSYSLLNHFVSELGWERNGRGALMFNAGLTVAGLAWMPVLWEMGRGLGTALGRVAGVSGVTMAAAASLVGLVPMGHIREHLMVAEVYFLSVPLTMIAFDLAFVQSYKLQDARGLICVSAVVLLAWLGFTVYPKALLVRALQTPQTFVRPAVWGLALLEWTLVLSVGLWMLTGAVYLVKSIRSQDEEGTSTKNIEPNSGANAASPRHSI